VAKLLVLMVTAFVDMVGLLMVLPLLPFYALELGGSGLIVGVLISSYAVAQLLSAPLWGRVSDRYGRRPALMVGIVAAGIAYVVFAYSQTIWMLLLSRLVQGAGGGTVGVIQAYVTDATEPQQRARALGWLSAATSAGVMVGPAIGSLSHAWGREAPGLLAAALALANLVFVWRYLRESRTVDESGGTEVPRRSAQAVVQVLSRPGEASSRLIWIYAVAMGAFQGMTAVLALFLAARFGVTERTIGFFFVYVGAISVVTRAGILGWAVDRMGELRLSRVGTVILAVGLTSIPLTYSLGPLALAVALVPLGTGLTFPCVTALLSKVIAGHERGLVLGVQQTFGGVARIVGPLAAGWAFDHLGMGVPFWVGAVLVLATVGLGIGLERASDAAAVTPRA
jgi:multidrug resistance protein